MTSLQESNSSPSPPQMDYSQHMDDTSSDTGFTDITSHSIQTTQTDSSINESTLHQRYSYHKLSTINEVENWYTVADRYGFIEENIKEPTDREKEKEVERATKWANMTKPTLINGTHDFEFSYKFIKRVYKGIPDSWRRDAWYYLCTDHLIKTQKDDTLKNTFETLLSQPTTNERQIDLDIPRTMHSHIMFRQRYGPGQCYLFNVLRAFANYDTEVGYCQGMASIVAVLLMYFEEEKAFSLLVHMFERDNLHDLYIPGFPYLMKSFYIQEKLLKKFSPKLANHMSEIGLTSDMFATRWYITLFTGGVIPYQILLRVWDLYFLNGYDFFYCVGVALLIIHKDHLFTCDLESSLSFLGGTISVSENSFIKLSKKLYDKCVSHNYITHYKNQYTTN
ncbi:unnamed protein product [Cunninghamella echinulata]